jgi:excisionase family DNA binding protein
MAKQPTTETIASSPRKRAYSVKETARELSLSVAQTYNLLNSGKLHGKKAGSRLVIRGEELDRYLDSLPPYEAGYTQPQLVGVKRGRRPRLPQAAPQKSGRIPARQAGRQRGEATAGA